MSDIKVVAVLGFGTMGSGIAQIVAQAGCSVIVLETDEGRVSAGVEAVAAFLAEGVRRGKLDDAGRIDVLSRIRGTTDVNELRGVDLVIEAVTERREVKVELLKRVAEVVGPDAIITTNTSALSVTDIASELPLPVRVGGLHFFNPPQLMRVVEVVQTLQSGRDVSERLIEFVTAIGKDPVVVKDRPGFLVNYLLMPYLNDVMRVLDEELASAEDIDVALKLGLGYKLGPLELLDLIGLDVHRHATESAYDATLDPKFAPPPLLNQMVAAGMYGNKNGRGFRTGGEDAR